MYRTNDANDSFTDSVPINDSSSNASPSIYRRGTGAFWICCHCGHVNNGAYCPEMCGNCGQVICSSCQTYSR